MLAPYQAFLCLFCIPSPVLFCVFHSPSVSCFTGPFLVSVSYFSLSLVFSCCLVFWFLTFCLVYWIPLLSSPLDIVRRSKTMSVYLSTHLPCPQYTCFAICLTMPINKSLHMDPHASHLVGPVACDVHVFVKGIIEAVAFIS